MAAISIPENRSETESIGLTVELAIYGLLAALSAILRWGRLGAIPMNPSEAREALTVWQFWQTAAVETFLTPNSPAYFSLTALLAPLIGFSDGAMRIVPAVAGVLLVAAIYKMRHLIGRFGAFVVVVLTLVSPTLVVASRTVGGDMLAILTAFFVIYHWWNFRRSPTLQTVYWLVGLCAFGLTTSPLFYGFVITFSLAWGLERLLGPSLSPAQGTSFTLSADNRRTAAIIGGLTLFLVATFFVTNMSGLTGLVNLPLAWLGSFSFSNDVLVWLEPLFALARYEFLALFLGLIATIWATWVGEPRANFLAYWYVISVALLLIQPGNLGNVLLLTLPAYLLIGRFCHILFTRTDWSWHFNDFDKPSFLWPLTGLLIALVAVAIVNLGRFARISFYDPNDISNLLLTLICVITMTFMWLIVVWWDRDSAWASGVLTLLLVGVLLNWGLSWRLGVTLAQDTRERWITEAADDELPLLLESLSEVARETRGSDDAVEIYSSVDHPLLRWYLRDLDGIRYVDTLPSGAIPDMAITPILTDPAFGSDYIGTDFGLVRSNNDSLLTNASMIRWLLFAQSFQEIPEERVVLWLRADLIVKE